MLAFLVATMHVEHSTRNLAVLDAAAKIAGHSGNRAGVESQIKYQGVIPVA